MQKRGRWEWDEGQSSKTQEKCCLLYPPHPTFTLHTQTHTQFPASFSDCGCVGEGVQMCTVMHVCLLKRSEAWRARFRHPWLINIHRSSRRLLWTEGRGEKKKEKKSNYEAMFCQMDKKHLVRYFAGYLPFDHCVCTSRFPGDGVCSFSPNSSSNPCRDCGQIVFKVALFLWFTWLRLLFFSHNGTRTK